MNLTVRAGAVFAHAFVPVVVCFAVRSREARALGFTHAVRGAVGRKGEVFAAAAIRRGAGVAPAPVW